MTTVPDAADIGMTRRDRDDLAKVARLRCRVAKAGVEARASALVADTESQLSTIYSVDDEAWAELAAVAEEGVRQADKRIAQLCAERGIPAECRPHLSVGWFGRGENALASRRAELRAAAKTAIAAAAKQAKSTIDAKTADVLTDLLAGGLSGEAAQRHLASIPSADELMPPVDLIELGGARMRPGVLGADS